ncbi:MAG: hypothetical protein H2172_15690 [Opitutus sp.]|nr:hypothetical protein [Opitutus sp.]MCS6276195.1 hypothetical protein [Opitutus sp.]MCS6301289.1 hypothetical protein [Opitutus sp.]
MFMLDLRNFIWNPLKSDAWIASLLTLVAGVIFYPFAAIGVDPHHDGIMLKPAMDVLSGQVLFRDTFSQYGPLTTYFQALALAVSPTLYSLRILTVLAYAGSLGFLYLAWRAMLPRSLSLVACLFFVVYAPFYHPDWPMLPWSSALALFFQSWAVLSLMRIVAGRAHPVWAWGLGIACACTLWCRQPVGIILTASVGVIAIALHVKGWRIPDGATGRVWGRVAAGFGVVTVLILGHLATHGAFGAWWEQNILWPKRWAQHADKFLFTWFAPRNLSLAPMLGLLGLFCAGFVPAIIRRAWSGLPRWADLVWLGVGVAAYFGFARALVRPWLLLPEGGWNALIIGLIVLQALWVVVVRIDPARTGERADGYLLAAMTGVALGSAAQIYPVPCGNHIYWALAPGLGLFVYLCWRWSRAEVWVCSLLVGLLLLPLGYDKFRWGQYTLGLPAITLESPSVLRGMRTTPERGQALQRLDQVLQPLLAANPAQPGMLYGDDALYLTWF